jgi:hypothetical protein
MISCSATVAPARGWTTAVTACPEVLVRRADDQAIVDVLHRLDDVVDLLGVHLLAPGVDHRRAPSQQGQCARRR